MSTNAFDQFIREHVIGTALGNKASISNAINNLLLNDPKIDTNREKLTDVNLTVMQISSEKTINNNAIKDILDHFNISIPYIQLSIGKDDKSKEDKLKWVVKVNTTELSSIGDTIKTTLATELNALLAHGSLGGTKKELIVHGNLGGQNEVLNYLYANAKNKRLLVDSDTIKTAVGKTKIPEGLYLVAASMGAMREIKTRFLLKINEVLVASTKINKGSIEKKIREELLHEGKIKDIDSLRESISESISNKSNNLNTFLKDQTEIKDNDAAFASSLYATKYLIHEILSKKSVMGEGAYKATLGSIEHLGHTTGNEAVTMRTAGALFEAWKIHAKVREDSTIGEYLDNNTSLDPSNPGIGREHREEIIRIIANATKIDTSIIKDYSTDKLINIIKIQAASDNLGDSADEKKILNDVIDEISSGISKYFSSREDMGTILSNLQSSPSMLGWVKKAISDTFSGKKVKKFTTKLSRTVSLLSKGELSKLFDDQIKKINKKPKASKGPRVSVSKIPTSPGPLPTSPPVIRAKGEVKLIEDLSSDNLLTMKNMINKLLDKEIEDNHMLPRGSKPDPIGLVYGGGWGKSYPVQDPVGRLAKSAAVDRITSSNGRLEIWGRYNEIYDVFEKQAARNPKAIVGGAMRNLAIDIMETKFNLTTKSLSKIRARFN